MAEFDEIPPMVPDRETVVAHEPIFVEACTAAFAADAEKFGWSYGKSLLTRSQKWGLIWRVDFVIPERAASSRWINRAMCWGSAGSVKGTAVGFGQQIAPLQ
jgi:hypothetical protein